MDRLFSDLTSGVRMLVRYPTLSLGAILTLGVGIGLSTTVFCVVNAGLFKGLPFPNAERIVSVFAVECRAGAAAAGDQPSTILRCSQARQTSFDAIGAYRLGALLTCRSRRAGRSGSRAASSPSTHSEALGVQPVLGRGFQRGGRSTRGRNVVLLGHDLWRDRYGSAADIVGKVDSRQRHAPLTVIGVMPATFAFPIRESLWVPLRVDPLATARGQGPRYPVVGLLKRGVSASPQATTQLTAIAAQLETRISREQPRPRAGALPYTETLSSGRKSTRCSSPCSAPASGFC